MSKRSASSESSVDGEDLSSPRKRLRTASFYSARDESEDETESSAQPAYGFGHQRSSSSSSSFGSPTASSGAGFGSPTAFSGAGFGSPISSAAGMGFGSPTGSAAFTYPTVTTGTLTNSSSSDGESNPANEYVKPAKVAQPQYSDKASRMMAKMGYKAGKGLGKNEQGRVNIVEASKQKGTRGLGMVLKSFEPADVEWDFDKEQVTTDESVDWLPKCKTELPSLETMCTWIGIGSKQEEIDEDTEFCSEKTLLDVIRCKSVFDDLEGEEMRRARTKSNPFETIRGVIFQNRAAMKMANIDAVLDFMFTNPKHPNGAPVVGPNELLYFADVCAGPGGFSEYVLWRKKWECKGFGFTLKGPCDFKLDEFFAAHSELFEPHYGVGGLNGDGDVYRPDNLQAFQRFVLDNTDGLGVHFMMADGGFDVAGKENFQEVLSKRLYLCQFLFALSILRPGGHFVCKLFDVFTVYSAGLIYLMWHVFEHVSIFKPVTSRPANSERYIVCKWKKPNADLLQKYFLEVNLEYDKLGGILSKKDINEVVPLSILKSSPEFSEYLTNSNERIGKLQCLNLVKIQTFTKNSDLHESRQADIRRECLKVWKVPDEVRTRPDNSVTGVQKFKQIIKETDLSYFSAETKSISPTNLSEIHGIYDHRCYVVGSDKTWIIVGHGKSNIWKWNGQSSSKWSKLDEVRIELPRDTVLKVEFVMELRGQGKGQRKVMAAHVCDAMFLCGTDVRDLHYNERMDKARKFVKAITRPTRLNLSPIRVKEIFRFEEVEQIVKRLDMRLLKGQGQHPKLCFCFEDERCFEPKGVRFVKIVQDPFMMAFSNSQGKKYYYNTVTRESVFGTPKDAIATFKCSCKGGMLWSWGEGVQVHPSQTEHKPSNVSAQQMINFVRNKMPVKR